MIDIITYIPDLDAFRAECKENAEVGNKYFSVKDGVITYNVAKIPVVYNADFTKSICLVRLASDEDLEEFSGIVTCERIGICENNEYVFDVGGQAIYESIYDTTQQTFIDEDGVEQSFTPSYMAGVFA